MKTVEMLIEKYEKEIEMMKESLKKNENPSTHEVMSNTAYVFLFRMFINDLKKLNEGIHSEMTKE